jgi:hypothetical protein
MAADDRLSVKLNPSVAEKFTDQQPSGMTHSEFVNALLDGAEIETGVTAAEVRTIVREELARATSDTQADKIGTE